MESVKSLTEALVRAFEEQTFLRKLAMASDCGYAVWYPASGRTDPKTLDLLQRQGFRPAPPGGAGPLLLVDMVEDVYPAIRQADAVMLLCPNYNDAVSANLTAAINRLTALYRTTSFSDKALFGIVVSGYSGGDIVARQLVSALCMGTRSGDLDAGILQYLMNKYQLNIDEMLNILNKKSGVQGVSGVSSDFRDLEDAAEKGNEQAALAVDMFNYGVKKLIGAYAAAMSRIEGRKVELHKEPVRAAELITHTLSGISLSAQTKGIKIIMKYKGFQNDFINVDRVRVQQIFTNLLSNAVKFTPGYGKIECLLECLSRESGCCLVRITIRDSGVGMSEEFLQHAFEPFAQEPNSQSNKYAGTGLGLPIVQNLVHLMGGSITLCSKLNEGTAVTVELPFELLEEYQPPVSDDAAAFFDLQGRRVLLCEDHPLNATITAKLLSKVGVEVEHAEDGQQGVDLFIQRSAGYYDAILMDIRMPVMDALPPKRSL